MDEEQTEEDEQWADECEKEKLEAFESSRGV